LKKFLVFVGVLVVIGIIALAGKSLASQEQKACVRMHDLCGGDWSAKDMSECTDSLERMKKISGDASFQKSMKCVDDSNSCAAAAGCMAGGVGVGAMGEFLKGFGEALTK
jgi:hypothetical protein